MAYFVKILKPVIVLGAAVLISGCATQQAAAPYQTASQPYVANPYVGQNGVAAEQYYDPAYPVDPYYQSIYAEQAPGYYYDPYPALGIGAVSVLAIGGSYYGNRYDDDYYYGARRGHGHAHHGGKKSGPKKARRTARQNARAEARINARNSAREAARETAREEAREAARDAARGRPRVVAANTGAATKGKGKRRR